VQVLLDCGVDPGARGRDGRTALMLASTAGRPAVVQLLIRRGADVNASASGVTAAACARRAHRLDIVAMLKKAGAK
jgi:ankyrin repeat protein